MLYKFIRADVEQTADQDVITSCFKMCDEGVKSQLAEFFNRGGDTIEFPQFNVIIKRVYAKKNNANNK